MENHGYLERGTLIQVGAVFCIDEVWWKVIRFKGLPTVIIGGRPRYNFDVEVERITDVEVYKDGAIYVKSSLEKMIDNGTLKVYNES